MSRVIRHCIRHDLRRMRTQVFVGLANLVPDTETASYFLRPLLLRLAGARVAIPVSIRKPLYIEHAGALSIGRWAFLNQGFRADGAAPIAIGERVLIGPFCCLENVNHYGCRTEALPITVGDGTWIGARAVLLPGTRVGEGSVIAAGAVVRGTVPPHQVWGGVPARCLKPSPAAARPAEDGPGAHTDLAGAPSTPSGPPGEPR